MKKGSLRIVASQPMYAEETLDPSSIWKANGGAVPSLESLVAREKDPYGLLAGSPQSTPMGYGPNAASYRDSAAASRKFARDPFLANPKNLNPKMPKQMSAGSQPSLGRNVSSLQDLIAKESSPATSLDRNVNALSKEVQRQKTPSIVSNPYDAYKPEDDYSHIDKEYEQIQSGRDPQAQKRFAEQWSGRTTNRPNVRGGVDTGSSISGPRMPGRQS